jgi:MoaA/NifB/PqqE/SkfB family radical SAM enzyme
MEKKLYLAYEPRGEAPFAYIFADNEGAAKEKALQVSQEQWELNKERYERFYIEVLKGKGKRTGYEKIYGPKLMDGSSLYVYHPDGDIYTV